MNRKLPKKVTQEIKLAHTKNLRDPAMKTD